MEPSLVLSAAAGAACLSLAAIASTRAAVGVLHDLPVIPPALVAAGVLAVSLTRVAAAAASTPPPAIRLHDVADERRGDAPSSDGARRHTVEPGECLWRIAAQWLQADGGSAPSSAAIAGFWPQIYEANQSVIGANPNLIMPGQVLLIPPVA